MRIVAGKFGGRKLNVPKGKDIRPTSDKVRGAIFNALQSRGAVEGARVLDCFCGTGALGLEALSRGAEHCTFIDKARTSFDLAQENAEMLAAENTRFILKDSTKLGELADDMEKFNLVFLDPPYERDLLLPCLLSLHNSKWLDEDAVLVVEVEKDFNGDLPEAYKILDEKIYGDTKILFLNYEITPE